MNERDRLQDALRENLARHRQAFLSSMRLLLDIQDRSPESHLRGCWRGMFDLSGRTWGGGDHFEGGANSIYTGWTNAPISTALALELLGRSLLPETG